MARILVFTRTTGYRHESIEPGVEAVVELAADHGHEVEHTEDASVFDGDLDRFAAVVWLSTDGDVLDDAQREAFAAWLRAGGGFAGVHGAAASEKGWPEFENIVGARFSGHPADQGMTATIRVEDATHPSTAHLPREWSRAEEWYSFERSPRERVRVLLSVDESQYDVGEFAMGDDHPLAWAGGYGEGRTWYTALGHASETWGDPAFREHVWGGIASVLRD